MVYCDATQTTEDRLSSLPNPILVDILSLLPLRSAIATSILSRQWHHLWTQINSLDFRSPALENLNTDFFTVVDNIVRRTTSPYIVKFCLSLGNQHADSVRNRRFLDSWLGNICARNIEEIKLSAKGPSTGFPILRKLFQTKSLVMLEVIGFWLDYCPLSGIDLPNLKKLSVTQYAYDIRRLDNLISSCPSLEELFLKALRCSSLILMHGVINISSKSLKRLDMVFPSYVTNSEIRIDSPNLKYFTLGTIIGEQLTFKFVQKPMALIGARIYRTDQRGVHQRFKMLEFLKNISHVRSLEVDHLRLRYLKEFPNLTRLSLGWPLPFIFLMKFLRCCPALEVLILNFVNAKDLKKRISHWCSIRSNSDPPTCLLICLKMVEIKMQRLQYTEWLMYFVKYMLQTSQILEKFTVRIDNGYPQKEDKLCDRHEEWKFCEGLLALSRSSTKCQLMFSGKYYQVSSNDELMI